MRWHWVAAGVLAAALSGCSDDAEKDREEPGGDASAEYCALLEEFQATRERFADESPDGEGGDGDARALELMAELSGQATSIAAAAPEEYAEVWSDWADGIAGAAASFEKDLVDPDAPPEGMDREDAQMQNMGVMLEVLKAMLPEDEEAAADLSAHARSECGVTLG